MDLKIGFKLGFVEVFLCVCFVENRNEEDGGI